MYNLAEELKNKNKLYDLFFMLLIFSLFFSFFLPNLFALILGVFVCILPKQQYIFKSNFFLFFVAATLVIILNSFYYNSMVDNYDNILKLVLVLSVMFLTSLISNRKKIENAFIIITAIIVIISCLKIFLYSYDHEDFILSNGSIVSELLVLERPYFGLVVTLANFIFLKRAHQKTSAAYDYYLLYFLFTAFNLYISARLGFVLSVALLVIFFIKNITNRKRNKILLILVLGLLFSILLGLSNNLIERMRFTNDFSSSVKIMKDYEPRYVIWPCAVSIISSQDYSLVTGLKNYQYLENKLIDCYKKTIVNPDKKQFFLTKKFNTHNQFLDFLLVAGFIPFILLLAVFVTVFISKSNFEMKIVFLLFLAFFLVENVLYRQLGCYLFGIFAVLYTSSKEINEKA